MTDGRPLLLFLRRVDSLESDEGDERLGDSDAAVSLLIIFQNRYHRAADGSAGTVERVHDLGLALRVAPEANLRAARLKVGAVRARTDFPVAVLSGQPDLDVIALGCVEADVAGTKRDHAVRQTEFDVERLRISDEPLEFFERILGRG